MGTRWSVEDELWFSSTPGGAGTFQMCTHVCTEGDECVLMSGIHK